VAVRVLEERGSDRSAGGGGVVVPPLRFAAAAANVPLVDPNEGGANPNLYAAISPASHLARTRAERFDQHAAAHAAALRVTRREEAWLLQTARDDEHKKEGGEIVHVLHDDAPAATIVVMEEEKEEDKQQQQQQQQQHEEKEAEDQNDDDNEEEEDEENVSTFIGLISLCDQARAERKQRKYERREWLRASFKVLKKHDAELAGETVLILKQAIALVKIIDKQDGIATKELVQAGKHAQRDDAMAATSENSSQQSIDAYMRASRWHL
jgi:hypothetical protein